MISIKNVTKEFDGGNIALDNLSLDIAENTVVGLIGSNGSGKSTLMRLLSGVYTPEKGEVLIDGENPYNNVKIKSQVFYVPDTPYFIHQSTIMEMARFYKTVHPGFSNERFNYLCKVFPLNLKQRISTMSKGMQRQAALMLALSCMPKYLLLDEAFDGLDPVIRQVLKRLLADAIATNGTTTIIASHNLRELEDLSEQIGLLHKGKLLLNCGLDDIKTRMFKVQVILPDETNMSALSSLDILKCRQQGSLLNMVVRGSRDYIDSEIGKLNPIFFEILPPTLEEVFIYELQGVNYDANIVLQ